MFSVISRLFTKLDLVDCSFLFKPVDNYTTLTPKPKSLSIAQAEPAASLVLSL